MFYLIKNVHLCYVYFVVLLLLLLLLLKEVGNARLRESDPQPNQSKDPSPTIPTYRQKEDKRKK